MAWCTLFPLLLALGVCRSLPVVDGGDLAPGARRPAVAALEVNAHGDVQKAARAGGSAVTIRRQGVSHKLKELRENVTSGEQRKANVVAGQSPNEEQFTKGELPWFCKSFFGFGLLQDGSQNDVVARQAPFEDERPGEPPDNEEGAAPETEWSSQVLLPPPPEPFVVSPPQQPLQPEPPEQPINVRVPAPPPEPRSIEDIVLEELHRFESHVASHLAYRLTFAFGVMLPVAFLVALCFVCIPPFKYATHVKLQRERLAVGLDVKAPARFSLPWLYQKGWRLVLGVGSTIFGLFTLAVAILGVEFYGLAKNLRPTALSQWILNLFEGVISLAVIAAKGEADKGWWKLFCNLLRTGYNVKGEVKNKSAWSLHVRRIVGSLLISHAKVYDVDSSWPFMPPNSKVTTTTAVVAKSRGLSFSTLRLGLGQIWGNTFIELGADLNIDAVWGGREIKVSTQLNLPCKTGKIKEVTGDGGIDVVRLTECIESGFEVFRKLEPPRFLISFDDLELSGSYIRMMTALMLVLFVLLTLLLAVCFGLATRWVGERKEFFPIVKPLRTATPGNGRSGPWQAPVRSPDASAARGVYRY